MNAEAVLMVFNLVCAGQEVTTSNAQGVTHAPYETVFRVDLLRGRWCSNDCEMSSPIIHASTEVIVLREGHKSDGSPQMIELVNRETGEHFLTAAPEDSPGFSLNRTGDCKPQPFTGLPNPKF